MVGEYGRGESTREITGEKNEWAQNSGQFTAGYICV